MTRNGKKKGNKRKSGPSDAGKTPGSVTGPKASTKINEDIEASSKDLDDYLAWVYGPVIKDDTWKRNLSLRDEFDIVVADDYFS